MSVIPNKVDIINGEWDRAYKHFRERLGQRYHMDISFSDYVILCKELLVDQKKES